MDDFKTDPVPQSDLAARMDRMEAEQRAFLTSLHPAGDLAMPRKIVASPPVDSLVSGLRNVARWCVANHHGNAEGTIVRIVRDLESLRSLPVEAWEAPIPEEPAPAEANASDSGKPSDLSEIEAHRDLAS